MTSVRPARSSETTGLAQPDSCRDVGSPCPFPLQLLSKLPVRIHQQLDVTVTGSPYGTNLSELYLLAVALSNPGKSRCGSPGCRNRLWVTRDGWNVRIRALSTRIAPEIPVTETSDANRRASRRRSWFACQRLDPNRRAGQRYPIKPAVQYSESGSPR